MTYDSTNDTVNHIFVVRANIGIVMENLKQRAILHDETKLYPPEKPIFDEYTPKLRNSTYGSDEYKQFLEGMGEGLRHHYAHNRHHPEHYANGFDGMSLLDIVEMLCDWKAAAERHADGSLAKSLEINKTRFGLSEQLYGILVNTAKELGWL